MSNKRIILTLLGAILWVSTPAFATTYYVDSSVSVSGTGSIASPWKGLSNISTNLQPGDIVSFKRNQIYSGTFTSTKSGTASSNIIFNTYGSGSAPKFTGTGSKIDSLFYIRHAYLTFDGFWITDPTISTTDVSVDAKIQRAFTIESNNVTVKNCEITLVGVAMYLPGGGSNTIDGCEVGNLRMVVDTDDGSQPGNDDDYGANPLVISSPNNKVINNYFYDLYATSYDYDYDGGAVEFYGDGTDNNLIAYNTIVDSVGIAEVNGDSSNNTFAYNKIINAGSLLYFQSGSTYSNWNIYNNVFVENKAPHVPESRLIGGSFGAGTVILKNNVFQLSNGIDVGNSVNIFHKNNVYKLSNGSVVGYALDSTETATSAALFTSTTGNPENWNYYPASTLLIDKGTNVGLIRDFDGTLVSGTPDIGVEEFVESTPPDTTNPTVNFTSPTSGTDLSGTATMTATASDASGIMRVDFYYGSTFIASDTASPFSVNWNTTGVSDGSYTLNAKAFDNAGNMGTASVSVTVKNATADTTKPTVSFSAPTNGSSISGTRQLSATASDANGITKIEFYDGGTRLITDTAAPYAYNWDTTGVMNGSHTLYAKAYDPSGNVQTASLMVTVSNAVSGGDTTAPIVTVVSPTDVEMVSGVKTVSINTSDSANAIKKIEVYDGSQILYVDSSAPYEFDWDTTTASDGNHTLTVKSYDMADNVGTAVITITISNLEPMDLSNIGDKSSGDANETTVSSGGCHSNGGSSLLLFLLPVFLLMDRRLKIRKG